jgi:hypothetical protein
MSEKRAKLAVAVDILEHCGLFALLRDAGLLIEGTSFSDCKSAMFIISGDRLPDECVRWSPLRQVTITIKQREGEAAVIDEIAVVKPTPI